MKKILVPIDFSEASFNAFIFAERIACKFDAHIDVVHIYDGLLDSTQASIPSLLKSKRATVFTRMTNFVNLPPSEGGISTKLEIGYKMATAFNKAAKVVEIAKDYDLVVVGMVSKHNIEKQWFGSFSSSVAQHASCPVLLVPRTAKYNNFQTMVYASNWESVNRATLQRMATWASRFKTFINFIHVNEQVDFDLFNYPMIQNIFKEYAPNTPHAGRNIEATSPLRGIYKYIQTNEIDLLVLVNRQRKWYENLFGASMTKELAIRTNVPILVYQLQKT